MDALLVVDLQCGLRDGCPKLDLAGVIGRVNRLAAAVRDRSGLVIWVQHAGSSGDAFAPGQPGWAFLPELYRQVIDHVVPKTLNDAFAGTHLLSLLRHSGVDRVLVCGWATDFCVDATVRSAVSNDFRVVAVSDAHTVSDRPHLDAASVIRHHNWLWANLISRRSIRVASTSDVLLEPP